MPSAGQGQLSGTGEFSGYVRSFHEDAGDGDGRSSGPASGQSAVGRVTAPDSREACDLRSRWGAVETTVTHSIRPALADRRSAERKPVATRLESGGSPFGRSPRRGGSHG